MQALSGAEAERLARNQTQSWHRCLVVSVGGGIPEEGRPRGWPGRASLACVDGRRVRVRTGGIPHPPAPPSAAASNSRRRRRAVPAPSPRAPRRWPSRPQPASRPRLRYARAVGVGRRIGPARVALAEHARPHAAQRHRHHRHRASGQDALDAGLERRDLAVAGQRCPRGRCRPVSPSASAASTSAKALLHQRRVFLRAGDRDRARGAEDPAQRRAS